ncbi:MAG: LytTR family DNA-binding domain-containing protein [Polyangiales bacterium]
MQVLIVDDEPLARRRLARLLAAERDVVVVGEAADAEAARAQIDDLAPDLVLLDIDMPGIDGLALARTLGPHTAVVFTTAHPKHAVEAFALAAVDYLLKPIDPARLADALARVRARGITAQPVPAAPGLVRLAARAGETIELLDPTVITRLHASDKYTLCRVANRELVLDESLSVLESRLAALGFFRAHRSELINLHRVRALRQEPDGTYAELDDGQRAPVSRRAWAELKQRLGI